MDIAGLALTTVALGETFITAIRGLRRLCDAVNEAPDMVNRLEQDGSTICLYLGYVDKAIAQKPADYPDSFKKWLDEEKKLLGRSIRQIEDYAKTIQQRIQSGPLVGGVRHVLDVTEIYKVQQQLARSISIIQHMMEICRQSSLDSRTAALRGEKSKRLRAQTASSLAEWAESLQSLNVSSSFEEAGGSSSEQPQSYQDVLKKSRPYVRAAMKDFFNTCRSDGGLEVPETSQIGQPKTATSSLGAPSSPLPPDSPESNGQIHTDDLPTGIAPPRLLAFSTTHSSSSHPPNSSTPYGWSITDGGLPSYSTPPTTRTDEPSITQEVEHCRRYVPLRVEIESLGKKTMDLDRLSGGDAYNHVAAAISTLRDEILRCSGVNAANASVTSKERGIIPYKREESQPASTIRLNAGYLAGAVSDLDSGWFAKLEIFAIFTLAPAEDEVSRIASTILGSQRTDTNRGIARAPTSFPTVETVLGLRHWTTSNSTLSMPPHPGTHASSSWSLRWLAQTFIPESEWPTVTLMPDGPDWCEKQLVAKGGSSEVYRVVLSQPHQLYFPHAGPFALKVLGPGRKRTFERELEAHMHLASANNPHIVTLLMAYERAGDFHFLFPWADGTLATFFLCRAVSPSSEAILWVIRQVSGLVKALHHLHSPSAPEEQTGSDTGARCGWHGDIKPDNILWFRRSSPLHVTADFGVLALTDFGLSRVQQHKSGQWSGTSSKDTRSGTLGYAPPDPEPSPSYDIFSLGCVLSEAAVWMTGGHDASRRFYSARFKDTSHDRGHHSSQLALRLGPPALSNPRSIIESLVSERRQGLNDETLAYSGLEAFLGPYCDLVELCVDPRAANRPSANQVVKCLETLEESIQSTLELSDSKAMDGPVPPSGAMNDEGGSGKALNLGPETSVDCVSAMSDPGRDNQDLVSSSGISFGEEGKTSHEFATNPPLPPLPGQLHGYDPLDWAAPLDDWQVSGMPPFGAPHSPVAAQASASLGQVPPTAWSTPGLMPASDLAAAFHGSAPGTPSNMLPALQPAHLQASTTQPRWRSRIFSRILPQLHQPLEVESCWPCKLSRKKCVGDGTPCERCAWSRRNSAIPCRRGLVCDATAEIPFLCHLPPAAGRAARAARVELPSKLQPAAGLLDRARRRRREKIWEMQSPTHVHAAECSQGMLCRVANTKVNFNWLYSIPEFEGLLRPAVELPYDELITKIVWELEDSQEAAQRAGVGAVEDLVALLEAASLCEARWGHFDETKLLVYTSICCLFSCLEAIRVSTCGLSASDIHAQCASADRCTSPAFYSLTKSAIYYTEELDRALFHKNKDKGSRWLLVFYSLCVQGYVRRAFISLEGLLHCGSLGMDVTMAAGSWPNFYSRSYLHKAVSLFREISIANQGKLAKIIYDSRIKPSVYLQQQPHASSQVDGRGAVTSTNAWQKWRVEGVPEFLERIFEIPITGSIIHHHPTSQTQLVPSPNTTADSDSDVTIRGLTPDPITAAARTPDTVNNAENDDDCWTMPPPLGDTGGPTTPMHVPSLWSRTSFGESCPSSLTTFGTSLLDGTSGNRSIFSSSSTGFLDTV